MERLKLKLENAKRALGTLEEMSQEPFSKIVRDASILRFHYTFEVFWKCVKEYLKTQEGLVCNSPKNCFRELLSAGVCNEEEVIVLQEMADNHNDAAHTYKEVIAEKIFSKIHVYSSLIKQSLNTIQSNLN